MASTSEKTVLLDVSEKKTAKVGWWEVSMVMAADVIGMGVLTLPKATAILGWAGSVGVMVLGLFASMFCSQLQVHVYEHFPESKTMADAFYWTTASALCKTEEGRLRLKHLVVASVYGFAFLSCGGYMLVLAKSLGGTMFDFHWCLPSWGILAMIVLFPLLQFRNLEEISIIGFASVALILMVVFVCAYTFLGVQQATGERVALNSSSSFGDIMASFGMIVFAYGGNWQYFELMSEMKEPKDFQKVWGINGPLQLGLYLLAGLAGYTVKGSSAQGYLLDELNFGTTFRVVSLMLFLHILVSIAIKVRILGNYVCTHLPNLTGGYPIISASIMMTGCALALSCPFFSELVSLLGALMLAPISYMLPIALFLGAKYLAGDRLQVPLWYWPAMALTFLGALCIMIVGTYSSLQTIAAGWSTFGAPFSCHCEDMWDTFECSADRMA